MYCRVLLTNIPRYLNEREVYDCIRSHPAGNAVRDALLLKDTRDSAATLASSAPLHPSASASVDLLNDSNYSFGAAVVDYESKEDVERLIQSELFMYGNRIAVKNLGASIAAPKRAAAVTAASRIGNAKNESESSQQRNDGEEREEEQEQQQKMGDESSEDETHAAEERLVRLELVLDAAEGEESPSRGRRKKPRLESGSSQERDAHAALGSNGDKNDTDSVESPVLLGRAALAALVGSRAKCSDSMKDELCISLFNAIQYALSNQVAGILLSLEVISDREVHILVDSSTAHELLASPASFSTCFATCEVENGDGVDPSNRTLRLNLEVPVTCTTDLSLSGKDKHEKKDKHLLTTRETVAVELLFVASEPRVCVNVRDNFAAADASDVLDAMANLTKRTAGRIAAYADEFGNLIFPSIPL